MSSSGDDWRNKLRAEITEAVLKDCKESLVTDIIDAVVNALLYDFNSTQNQTIADTFLCRDVKSNLAYEPTATRSSRVRKVPKKGKAKQVGQNQLRISPEGRLVTAEEADAGASYDPRHA